MEPNKGKLITGQSRNPRVHLPNQRCGMLDKLSHNAHKPDKLSQDVMQNILNKKGAAKKPRENSDIQGQAEIIKINRDSRFSPEHCRKLGKRHKAYDTPQHQR